MRDSTTASAGMRPFAAALAAAAMLLSGAASAQADLCARLSAELAAVSVSARGNPAQIARFDAAISSQREQIAQVEAQAASAGCGRASASTVCLGIEASRNRMQRNLVDLTGTRDRMAAEGGLGTERERISAALSDANCSSTSAGVGAQVTAPNEGVRILGGRQQTIGGGPAQDQRYATVCVRLCDGYFFPLSRDATASMFGHDEQLCSARCPGTATQLHFRTPGQEPADMLSVSTGARYGNLPTAFAYRRTDQPRPAACGCSEVDTADSESGWREIGEELRRTPATSERTASVPAPTLPKEEQPAPVPATPEDRRVRVVGPTFLPDPGQAIDLRAPAPAPVP